MDYLDSDFAKLKYTETYVLLIRRDQSHLDSYTDLISTWLHPKIFHHWIRNSVSLALKYSELLANHLDNLRSERHLYPYPSRAILDSRVLYNWSLQWWCTPTSHLHAIPVSPYHLVTRTTNVYGTQWPTLDIALVLVIAYRLVTNQFKDYVINPLLSIKVILRTSL